MSGPNLSSLLERVWNGISLLMPWGIVMSVEDTAANAKICLDYCENCPSYPKGSGEALYCSRGISKAQINRQGCLCPGCTVYEKYNLVGTYFCAEGKTK